MKIQQIINHSNQSATNTRKITPTFKGLWGEDTYYSQHDSTYDIDDTTHHYYPFSDETEEMIAKIKKDHTDGHDLVMSGGSDPHACSNGYSVEVHEKLPFTLNEFEKYMKNCLYDLRKKVIENHIMEKKLRIKL